MGGHDLISRSALLRVPNVCKVTEYDETGCGVSYLAVPVTAIEAAPAVDAEPVCHGHWIEDHMRWKCSCCRTVFHDELERIRSYDGRDMPKYCPECGAKMDGDVNG